MRKARGRDTACSEQRPAKTWLRSHRCCPLTRIACGEPISLIDEQKVDVNKSDSTPATEEHWRVDPTRITAALDVARRVVAGQTALDDLKAYYRWESNYAGATFNMLSPNDPWRIEAADLLAVTTLSVDIPPMAIRRLTEHETAGEITGLLNELDPSLRIDDPAARAAAPTMAKLYSLVKSNLRHANAKSSSAWVTASKICARKRPHLFPVRDSVVVKFLGLAGSYPDDWPVFAALSGDADLMRSLDELVATASAEDGVDVGDPTLRLRHLDVLLWMHGMSNP